MNSPPTSTTLPSPSEWLSVRPPPRSRASSTATDLPDCTSVRAAESPASPAPTTTTSTFRVTDLGCDLCFRAAASAAAGSSTPPALAAPPARNPRRLTDDGLRTGLLQTLIDVGAEDVAALRQDRRLPIPIEPKRFTQDPLPKQHHHPRHGVPETRIDMGTPGGQDPLDATCHLLAIRPGRVAQPLGPQPAEPQREE